MPKLATLLAQAGLGQDPRTGAISTPIYQCATFEHPALGQSTGFDYSRTANPTRKVLEDAVARVDGGTAGFAFATGLAALSTVFCLFNSGDHLILAEGCYGGTYRLMDQIFARLGLTVTYVPVDDVAAFEAAITPATRGILVESVSNPCLIVPDLPALTALAKAHELLFMVDNTFLTPYWLRPLEQGADLVVHSGSKYLSGHNDTLAGLITVKDPALAERVAFLQNAMGAVLGPQDAWLVLRGLKTLALRLEAQQKNAQTIARWLATQDFVETLYYPGLETDPQHQRLAGFASGFGAMLSFTVKSVEVVKRLIERTRLIAYAESLGGVESLITVPAVQTHANLSEEQRNRLGVTDTLIRLSVGIEDVDDLIDDLAQALKD